MKYTVAALLAALATTCFAQTINIIAPPNDTSVGRGKEVELAIQYPGELIGIPFSVAILQCIEGIFNNSPCQRPKASDAITLVDSIFDAPPDALRSPVLQQNILVSIPRADDINAALKFKIEKGPALLFVTYRNFEQPMGLGQTIQSITVNITT